MAEGLYFVLEGDEALAGKLRVKADVVTQRLKERVDAASAMLADKIRSNLSGGVIHVKSGALLDTVRQLPTLVRSSATGRFASVPVEDGQVSGGVEAGGPNAPYGIVQEKGGTRQYEIVPVNKRILAFMADGKQIFTRHVDHPPLIARYWFSSAVNDLRDEIVTSLKEAALEP